jgi:hypothetical protein
MNRTFEEATVKKFYYQTHQYLKEHLHAFPTGYTASERLNSLRGLTPGVLVILQKMAVDRLEIALIFLAE